MRAAWSGIIHTSTRYRKFPYNAVDQAAIKAQFAGYIFPKVFGDVDCTHISIKVPPHDENVNRNWLTQCQFPACRWSDMKSSQLVKLFFFIDCGMKEIPTSKACLYRSAFTYGGEPSEEQGARGHVHSIPLFFFKTNLSFCIWTHRTIQHEIHGSLCTWGPAGFGVWSNYKSRNILKVSSRFYVSHEQFLVSVKPVRSFPWKTKPPLLIWKFLWKMGVGKTLAETNGFQVRGTVTRHWHNIT